MTRRTSAPGWHGQPAATSGALLPGVRSDVAAVARTIAAFEPVAMVARPDQARGRRAGMRPAWRSSNLSTTTCGCATWARFPGRRPGRACGPGPELQWLGQQAGPCPRRPNRPRSAPPARRPQVHRPIRLRRRRAGGQRAGHGHGDRELDHQPQPQPRAVQGPAHHGDPRLPRRQEDDLGSGAARPRHHRRSHRRPGQVRPRAEVVVDQPANPHARAPWAVSERQALRILRRSTDAAGRLCSADLPGVRRRSRRTRTPGCSSTSTSTGTCATAPC